MLSENISTMKTYASKNAVPIIQDGGCEFICNYIRQHSIKSVLEIGTAIGYSSIQFAHSGAEKILTIEKNIDRYLKACDNVKNEGFQDKITIIHGDCLGEDVLSQIASSGEKYDLVFIDGPKAQYMNCFEQYKNFLSEDGVIITDNLSFHGMVENIGMTHNYSTKKLIKKIQKYIAFLENNEEFSTEFFPVGDRVSVSKRK